MLSILYPPKGKWAVTGGATARRFVPRRYPRMLFLGLALLAAGGFAVSKLAIEGLAPHDHAMINSPAYQFGYFSAALAACEELDTDLVDELASQIQKDPSGRVPSDISRGFAAFSHALDTIGPPRACSADGALTDLKR